MRKEKSLSQKMAKETSEARKRRVTSGIRFRAAVFEDKRRKLRDKAIKAGENQ